MSFENRGRHKKGVGSATGKGVKFKNTTTFTPEGNRLKLKWEKLSDKERGVWLFNFEGYRKAHE